MKSLSMEHFHSWLEMYGKASKENDPQASVDLFAHNAKYYESPFKEPMIGHGAIFEYWNRGANNLKDKESSYEIFSTKDNLGIAHWRSNFTVVESDERFALDCLFVVEFDEDGRCTIFREWWHLQPIDTNSNDIG